MHASPIRAIFFDVVGTLIHPEPSAGHVYFDVGRRHGSRLTLADTERRFRTAFRRQEEIDRAAGWATSEDRELRRWRDIVAEVLDDVDDAEACFGELYEHFARPQAWRVDPAAESLLPALAAQGYALGLASNYDHRLHVVATGLPSLRFATNIVVSSEVGWRKPGRTFFEAVIRSAGAPPAKILFIGDDYENDYLGAEAAGLRAILIDPGQTDILAGRVPTLAEVPKALQALGERGT